MCFVVLPPVSSSAENTAATCAFAFSRISARQTAFPRQSHAPRPYRMPSRITGSNCSSSAGTTSMCEFRMISGVPDSRFDAYRICRPLNSSVRQKMPRDAR